MSVLDLPDLVLESIFEKLPPEGLCKMACVCASLRDRCMSDHLWEKHIKNKWARVVGTAAYREWQWRTPSRKGSIFFNPGKHKGLIGYLNYYIWPVELIRSSFSSSVTNKFNSIPTGSIMSWYFALESGKFWFPAQVYNRENGHVGFMLSCYDAELCYDMKTNTFQARYPPHGRRASPIEIGVTWDRLRASPVDTSPHDLHISDCLKQLKPGDHIEIQWRRNKEFPYGWWYGVVGHLETCDGNPNYCLCQDSGSSGWGPQAERSRYLAGDQPEKLKLTAMRSEIKKEYRYVLDITNKIVMGMAGSYDQLSSAKFMALGALIQDEPIDWSDYIFRQLVCEVNKAEWLVDEKKFRSKLTFGTQLSWILEKLGVAKGNTDRFHIKKRLGHLDQETLRRLGSSRRVARMLKELSDA